MNCLFVKRFCHQFSGHCLRSNTQSKQLVTTLRQLNSLTDNVPQNQRRGVIGWHASRRWISCAQDMNRLLINRLNDSFVEQKRFKKDKKRSKKDTREEFSDDEDSDSDAEVMEDPDLIDGKAIGFQDIRSTLVSLRLDNIMKSGLGIQRAKVEEAFYGELIRVNGERVSKKSAECVEEDVIDLIRGLNKDNNDLIDVSRLVVKEIESKMSSKERVYVTLRRFKLLTIENYINDPYEGYAINNMKDKESQKKDN